MSDYPMLFLALAALNLFILLGLTRLVVGLRRRVDAQAQAAEATQLVDPAQMPSWPWLRSVLDASQREQLAQAERLVRTERELREALQTSARDTRLELTNHLAESQRLMLAQSSEVARAQNEQIDAFRIQLATMQSAVSQALQSSSGMLAEQLAALQAGLDQRLAAVQAGVEQRLGVLQGGFEQRVTALQTGIEQKVGALQGGLELKVTALQDSVALKVAALQGSVEARLLSLQTDNEKKLEQMRATVDEKLHATLEARLGESFKQVAERLEQVHRGLGEMQTLAQGVGDLKRVLTNVKSRGVFGEVQLLGLLEQVFAPEQYGINVVTRPGSNERVEFAIRLPGREAGVTGSEGTPVWLPIDAKFPREDYERLLDAQERADREATEAASKALEQRIRDEARTIRTKYLQPPHTTDFAILFLPTEGLYAELLRRPGLNEALMKDHHVTLAGPTTLLAMLNSLQMGFRTLAIEQRSSEVWTVLGAVKTEFTKFGDVLAKTKKKLDEASNSIGAAEVRTRAMARQLRSVEALPDAEARALLPLDAGAALDRDDEAALG